MKQGDQSHPLRVSSQTNFIKELDTSTSQILSFMEPDIHSITLMCKNVEENFNLERKEVNFFSW